MMIRKYLLFVVLPLGMVTGLMSCLESGNRTSMSDLAVMVYNQEMQALAMHASSFVCAAPQLQNLKENDCILAKFTIDFDNQPSNQYYTVTISDYNLITKDTVRVKPGDLTDEYTDSLRIFQLFLSPLYNGHLFIQTEQVGTSNYVYDLELICNPDSIDENGIHTAFLKSKLINGTPNQNLSSYVYPMEAFDVNRLIDSYGKDTTIVNFGYSQDYKYLSLNFKYQSGIKENEPVYTSYGKNPVIIKVFKKG
jgi:hypothetical protein